MKLLDRKELVEATDGKLSHWMVGDLTRKRQIPHVCIGKRRYLYDIDAVAKWLENLQAQSVQPERVRRAK